MARYAWKTTGADGTEATGTFAFTSLNTITLEARVDVDGTLISDGDLGYSGGFGRSRVFYPDPSALEAGDEVALEVRGAHATFSIDAAADRWSIRTLNLKAGEGTLSLLNSEGEEHLRLALNKAIEDVDPEEIVASSTGG
jgi:hypothetical protein